MLNDLYWELEQLENERRRLENKLDDILIEIDSVRHEIAEHEDYLAERRGEYLPLHGK